MLNLPDVFSIHYSKEHSEEGDGNEKAGVKLVDGGDEINRGRMED